MSVLVMSCDSYEEERNRTVLELVERGRGCPADDTDSVSVEFDNPAL